METAPHALGLPVVVFVASRLPVFPAFRSLILMAPRLGKSVGEFPLAKNRSRIVRELLSTLKELLCMLSAKEMTIEEIFRDQKSHRNGFSLR